jgi:hypothetical protein
MKMSISVLFWNRLAITHSLQTKLWNSMVSKLRWHLVFSFVLGEHMTQLLERRVTEYLIALYSDIGIYI